VEFKEKHELKNYINVYAVLITTKGNARKYITYNQNASCRHRENKGICSYLITSKRRIISQHDKSYKHFQDRADLEYFQMVARNQNEVHKEITGKLMKGVLTVIALHFCLLSINKKTNVVK
jgi:hypothetical protein